MRYMKINILLEIATGSIAQYVVVISTSTQVQVLITSAHFPLIFESDALWLGKCFSVNKVHKAAKHWNRFHWIALHMQHSEKGLCNSLLKAVLFFHRMTEDVVLFTVPLTMRGAKGLWSPISINVTAIRQSPPNEAQFRRSSDILPEGATCSIRKRDIPLNRNLVIRAPKF